MSTAIMQTGAMGWDYKFHDWNESNDVGDIQLKVSILNHFFIFHLQIDKTNSNIDNACSRVWICVQNDVSFLDYYQFI